VATATRGRRLWTLVAAAVAVVIIVVLAVLLVVALARPAPVAVSTTPTPSPEPTPSASPSPAATTQQDHREYRAYVSAAIQGGAAVVASLGGLVDCRDGGQSVCASRIHDASDQVATYQDDLAANPAPQCLSDADAKLQDALTFLHRGLDTAEDAVTSQNRVRLAQGALLSAAGVWRAGQAVRDARQSNC
jgi:hypothetical protein